MKTIMTTKAVFEGLVFDENDQQLSVSNVGNEATYVIDDDGFLRHIPSEEIDRQVLGALFGQIENNKEAIAEQTIKMIGRDDLFTHAIIQNQLENVDDQMDRIIETGLPEDGRSYLGMLGFKVVVNYHGEVIRVEQPALPTEGDE
ncbi:MAG: hypothetical protein PWQ55_133 [Chloroflexota bacterium]|nr:hypothetical protein [Chloroflexota bacterium]